MKMNEPFFATLKLTTGEEVLAEVVHEIDKNTGDDFFVVSNPIVINETTKIDYQRGAIVSGLVPKKWMLYANDDMAIVHKHHVISVSELDKFGIEFYFNALKVARISSPIKRNIKSTENSGFIGDVTTSRQFLEKIYNL
ncbi:hypothetical cyanophage protein [Synechococcus phage S-CRM01]|uniref:methylamine utilization n=1 Tax=Synechococcus phage S-CRM01 TaxID=1026955 RepID=UPI000209E35A|nr:methylamine utilization [Synechococcus phage S-CRM01]AEC52995.1 hypothetical cyanophage protein [Synechococcus phage S-CRM01]